MRTSLQIVAAMVLALALAGCASHADVETIGRYGGYSTPAYYGSFAECPPIAAIDFSTRRQIITDDDLEAMLPALKRLNPRRICLGGQPITDRSIEVLNQLPYLQSLSLEGTNVTPQGRGRLRLAHYQ
jgi:hypothetical protein